MAIAVTIAAAVVAFPIANYMARYARGRMKAFFYVAVMLPMWIGSGIFFSTDRFPAVVQPVLSALPLTPLIHALRSVMLEGTSLLSLGPQLALILAWGTATFVLALRWFRWN